MRSKRLFFTLWPDDKTRAELDAIIRVISDENVNLTPRSNLHLTLLFLGQVSELQLDALLPQVDKIYASHFNLEINRSGWWRKPSVLWLGPGQVPASLTSLVDSLKALEALQSLKLDEKPFKPHVTIARKVKKKISLNSFQPIAWKCESFSLIESISSEQVVRYQVIYQWPLH